MRELILIFTYIVCAFVPVLVLRGFLRDLSHRLFWVTWFISLIGAFCGGVFGTMIMHRLGLEFGFVLGAVPALVGAWVFTGLFLGLRTVPENW